MATSRHAKSKTGKKAPASRSARTTPTTPSTRVSAAGLLRPTQVGPGGYEVYNINEFCVPGPLVAIVCSNFNPVQPTAPYQEWWLANSLAGPLVAGPTRLAFVPIANFNWLPGQQTLKQWAMGAMYPVASWCEHRHEVSVDCS